MIAANELRIGSWVLQNDSSKTTVANKVLKYVQLGQVGNRDASLSDAIPLTPEILEKCGFEKSEFENKEQWLSIKIIRHNPYHEYRLGIMNDSFVGFYFVSFINTRLKYLHQLQNLYFALTGEELEINF